MINNSVSWGILGCGDVAEVKSGPAFYKVDNSNLVGVMRRNKDKVVDFAKRHHVSNWTTNATDLIENPAIDALYIATPPSSHLEYALQSIKAGKNVYLEKPMVLNSREADILVNALENSKVKVTVAHYRRELPVFLKVKNLLDSNIIGKVTSAKIVIKQTDKASLIAKSDENWRTNPEISGGGYFHDIAPHQIDLMCYYFGEVIEITKDDLKENLDSNQEVNGSLLFKNGVKFSGSWNFNASEEIDNCTIHGEKGTISFSFYGDEIVLNSNGEEKRFLFTNPKHVQQPMIEKTVNYFLGKSQNPCTVNEAAIVTRIMDLFCGLD
ncbi:Gfo/Idh/MocA family protein [Algibacter pacificus]|uniref:Gfo/Idh/MocA family protein n=1 Tax=Algibacter pacificus TaxID=2599389 RepID=UPI0011CB20F3|nr:Gfo/Idh/MocA family oxidoreductase [Algibacter pacificus]